MPDWLVWPSLTLLGVAVGTYGTMIGAGGGFVLVPLLLFLYPHQPPELLTSISLAVVFFNVLSGSTAYARQKRVDFVAGNIFALASIPGAIGGALLVSYVPRRTFDMIFATMLLAVSTFLVLRPAAQVVQRRDRRGLIDRELTDAEGYTYRYSYNVYLGAFLSAMVGFISGLLGTGGGVIHVPIMVQILLFPAHIATATSHYVLTISSLTGTSVHILNGDLAGGYARTAALGVGVLIGAQVGARLSRYLEGSQLIRLLAVAMALVAVRLLIGGITG
ncbi:MAG TPA: sulfite exporter TauE/SafE family protein [Dehalococcoidia bacterium]|nr:sulfite exporter TauE/SafE family protein [Dehalococcoidia bacterium]